MLFPDKDGIRPVKLRRWFNIDPMAEKYGSYSPYVYCLNYPISFIDPKGMEIIETNYGVTFTGNDMIALLNFLKSSNPSSIHVGKEYIYVKNSGDLGGSGDNSMSYNPSGPKGADGLLGIFERGTWKDWEDVAEWNGYYSKQEKISFNYQQTIDFFNQKQAFFGNIMGYGGGTTLGVVSLFASGPFGLCGFIGSSVVGFYGTNVSNQFDDIEDIFLKSKSTSGVLAIHRSTLSSSLSGKWNESWWFYYEDSGEPLGFIMY